MRYSRYLLLILFPFFFSTSLAQSEWKWIQPQPTGEKLVSLEPVDQNTGYGIFTNSIMKTTDAGESWTSLLSTNGFWAPNFFMINRDEIWFAGNNNLLYSSKDGGKTWSNQSIKSIDAIRKIAFFNQKNGMILGTRTKGSAVDLDFEYDLLKTTDGGKTWKTEVKSLPVKPEVFAFTDANTMWAAEGYMAPGTGLWNSTDGGKTWNRVQQFEMSTVRHISFKGNHAYVLAKQPIVGGKVNDIFIAGYSFDAGKTWEIDYQSFNDLSNKSGEVEALFFLDGKKGWLNTFAMDDNSSKGELWGTEDGGKSWKPLSSYENEILGNFGFFDSKKGLFSLSPMMMSPKMKRTTDGGVTFADFTKGMENNFFSFYFIDEQTGFAGDGMGMLRTIDGGGTWKKVNTPGIMNFGYFKFFDSKNGVAGGAAENQYGPGYGFGTIYSTSDAGLTWKLVGDNNLPVISKITFVSPSIAYGIRGDIDGQKVVKSFDGGKSWSELKTGKDDSESLIAIFFTDANTGWISGVKAANDPTIPQNDSYFIRFTADGGKTWKEQLRKPGSPYNQKIFFSDSMNGCITFAESSAPVPFSYITNDGGKKWTPVEFKDEVFIVNTLHFTDKMNGYLYFTVPCPDCGSLIYATTDGGKSWKKKWELPAFGQNMFFLNSKTFWAGGLFNLMKYTGK